MRNPYSYTEFAAFMRSYCREALTSQYLAFWGLCFAPSARQRRPRTLRPRRYALHNGALVATCAATLEGR